MDVSAHGVAGRNGGAGAEQRPKPRDARIQIRDMQCHRSITLRAVRMNPDLAFAKAPRTRRHIAAQERQARNVGVPICHFSTRPLKCTRPPSNGPS